MSFEVEGKLLADYSSSNPTSDSSLSRQPSGDYSSSEITSGNSAWEEFLFFKVRNQIDSSFSVAISIREFPSNSQFLKVVSFPGD